MNKRMLNKGDIVGFVVKSAGDNFDAYVGEIVALHDDRVVIVDSDDLEYMIDRDMVVQNAYLSNRDTGDEG